MKIDKLALIYYCEKEPPENTFSMIDNKGVRHDLCFIRHDPGNRISIRWFSGGEKRCSRILPEQRMKSLVGEKIFNKIPEYS